MVISDNRKPSLLLMVLLLFSTQACTDIFLSGLPQMEATFNETMLVTNLTISIYNYSQAFFVLFIGVISDLNGRRSTILICLVLHIVASICIALSNSISIVILMRIIQALGSAAIYIILRLIIKDTMEKKAQIHATGLLVIGLVLSPILAPTVGAWIIHFSNWRACFWVIAIFEMPLLIWALITIKETNHKQLEFRASFSIKNHFLSYYLILKDRYFLSLALIVGATFAAFYAFISISSYLYINQYNIGNINYSYIFIGIALFYLIGNRIMSNLNANNTSPQKIIKIGIYTSLFGTALILAALCTQERFTILAFITIGSCFLRLATALINPPVQVVITNHFLEKGSYALGLLTCIQYSFAAIGTMTVSWLSLQPSHNFMISTLIFIILSIIGYVLCFKNRINT
ncbi:MAG: MFS transporter [Burkholderiales bacterium]|jgi:DHA1 family bicyclomycin/chloramphenicol resistance-like MFS transporter|nr:MFS transporter [Burkholderiales bacterium]MBP9769579.1 MFS transporter [Burkholderiales bacterium]